MRVYWIFAGLPIFGVMATLGQIVFWAGFPALVAAGSAAVVYLLMCARVEVLRSRYEAAVADLKSAAGARTTALESAAEAAFQRGREAGMREFIAGMQVQERRYIRKQRRLTGPDEERLVVEERICLGNIPLTNWHGQEIAAREFDSSARPVMLGGLTNMELVSLVQNAVPITVSMDPRSMAGSPG